MGEHLYIHNRIYDNMAVDQAIFTLSSECNFESSPQQQTDTKMTTMMTMMIGPVQILQRVKSKILYLKLF